MKQARGSSKRQQRLKNAGRNLKEMEQKIKQFEPQSTPTYPSSRGEWKAISNVTQSLD